MNIAKLVVCAALPLAFSGCEQVDPGEVAFKTKWGKIQEDTVLREGLWFYNPIGGDIVVYDIKNQIVRFKMEQYTKDVQQSDAKISVTYHLEPDHVIAMHKETGRDYENKIIYPSVLGCFKNVIGSWNATDVIGKREHATEIMVENLKKKLAPYGISVTLVEILDISFKPKFEDAVEAKQIAEQEANRAKNLTVKIEEEAKQKVIAAKAEAEAMAVRAKALEQNKSLVEYEAVMKWNGVLPQYMMGNTIPFINLDQSNKSIKERK